MTTTSFDARAFRRALGNFATGVTVVTAQTAAGEKAGVTANSFNSVSLDPPLILWSIDKRSSSLAIFEQASHFAVNILAADQIGLSNRFARPSEDKFAGVELEQGAGGAPLLKDCAARFQCQRYQQVDAGDHWILIGEVVAFDDFGRAPLLYHQGAYSAVLPHPQVVKGSEEQAVDSHFQDRLSQNLYYLMTQAVRRYQTDYQPRQLSTGLRTSEARMLMVLEQDATLTQAQLLAQVGMPAIELEAAIDNLKRKGLVEDQQGFRLNAAGVAQAETLWRIAREQQDNVFAKFSTEQLQAFRQVLSGLVFDT